MVKIGAKQLKADIDLHMARLGDRPYNRSRLSLEEQYAAYREMRQQPYALWGMMEAARQEIEARLVDHTPEEREDAGLGDQEVRALAMVEVIRRCAKMAEYEQKMRSEVSDSTSL